MPKLKDVWYCNCCLETFNSEEELDEHYRLDKEHLKEIFSPSPLRTDVAVSPSKKIHYADWGNDETLCFLKMGAGWVETVAVKATCKKCLDKEEKKHER